MRPGVALTVESTFGLAANSDRGPSADPGFTIDDTSLLATIGADAVRLTFDWARLQPHPERVDSAWVERYDELLGAADAAGLEVWACALDHAVPRWFDNEGGLDDAEALTRRWPRWFEVVVDRWGDRIAGWVPFDVAPAEPRQVWADTRGILRGGPAPAAYTVAIDDATDDTPIDTPIETAIERLIGPDRPEADALAIAGPWTNADRAEHALRSLADSADVAIARATITDPPADTAGDTAADTAADLRRVVDAAAGDGIALLAWFVDPWRIVGDDGLVGRDGQPTEAARVCFS
ncbi:MAG: family 1 glycosylhydrolase [Actinomycetota bacterium]